MESTVPMVDGPQEWAGPTRGAHDVCENLYWESHSTYRVDSAKAVVALADSCGVAFIVDRVFDHPQHSHHHGIELEVADDDFVGC